MKEELRVEKRWGRGEIGMENGRLGQRPGNRENVEGERVDEMEDWKADGKWERWAG